MVVTWSVSPLPAGYKRCSPLLHHSHSRPGHHGPRDTLRLQLRHQADTDGGQLEEHDQHYRPRWQPAVLAWIINWSLCNIRQKQIKCEDKKAEIREIKSCETPLFGKFVTDFRFATKNKLSQVREDKNPGLFISSGISYWQQNVITCFNWITLPEVSVENNVDEEICNLSSQEKEVVEKS